MNTFIDILSLIVACVYVIGFLILLIVFLICNNKKKHIESMIKSLGKYDFTIENEIREGRVRAYPEDIKKHGDGIEYVNKTLDLDGSVKFGIDIPLTSISLYNDDLNKACEWIKEMGGKTRLMISNEQYSEYLDLVNDCNVVTTQSFYLKIKLSNENVNTQINKWNVFNFNCHIITEYKFERYNVLNLVTDMKPFSDEEVDELIDKIKERMIERLCMS